MTTDDLARRGFATGTDVYHRARPAYRAEMLTHLSTELGLRNETRVLDLAAGTGRMTRELISLGADVTAVEPAPAMRATFRTALPDVPVTDGTAERIPFPDAAFDAVVVAQAFHWFDGPKALREIARVLRPGGALALVWNARDESEGWAADLGKAVRWPFTPWDVDAQFRTDLADTGRFDAGTKRDFRWTDRLTHHQFVERIGTFSYIVAMPTAEREALLTAVRTHLASLPDPLDVPYTGHVFITRAHP